MPGCSLCRINPLEGFVEICCKSKKSRSSAKIRDHAGNLASRDSESKPGITRSGCFPELASGSSCPRSGQPSIGVASTPLNPRARAVEKSRPLSRVLSWTVIPLGCASPRSSSGLPGSLMWATWCGLRRVLPYLALLQVGFAVPRMLPPARCALTAPFHPYRRRLRGT